MSNGKAGLWTWSGHLTIWTLERLDSRLTFEEVLTVKKWILRRCDCSKKMLLHMPEETSSFKKRYFKVFLNDFSLRGPI